MRRSQTSLRGRRLQKHDRLMRADGRSPSTNLRLMALLAALQRRRRLRAAPTLARPTASANRQSTRACASVVGAALAMRRCAVWRARELVRRRVSGGVAFIVVGVVVTAAIVDSSGTTLARAATARSAFTPPLAFVDGVSSMRRSCTSSRSVECRAARPLLLSSSRRSVGKRAKSPSLSGDGRNGGGGASRLVGVAILAAAVAPPFKSRRWRCGLDCARVTRRMRRSLLESRS